MEAVDLPERADAPPLQLLAEWRPEEGFRGKAWAGSVLLHVAAVAALAFARFGGPAVSGGRHLLSALERSTHLIAPPPPMTQKAPNRGTIGKEFDLQSLLPRPRLRMPPGAPPAPRMAPVPPPPARVAPPVPEPLKMEGQLAHSLPNLGTPLVQAPPQIQPEEKPKLAFETPGTLSGAPRGSGVASVKIPPPPSTVNEAIHAAARQGPSGGIMVGDLGMEGGPGSMGPGLNLPPSPGRTGSTLELLSDPSGVDFKPYLIRILATVRRNWLAVTPQSARLGRSGRVQIQFAISRDGRVPKLVIALPSGTEALDRAAVAGISASNPFPPLPDEFRGEQIRLQFTFLYNMPVR